MLPEIDYSKDPQNVSPYCYDIFGDEVYKGDAVYCGDEGKKDRAETYEPQGGFSEITGDDPDLPF